MPTKQRLREVASTFHKNFSKGDFEANGPLVAEDIEVDSNNARLSGRDAFVQRIRRFEVPFRGLQLKDRYIVVDGNRAGVHYLMQGRHVGPYGEHSPSGHTVEVMAGEIFEFNDNAQMARLTTITKLDDLVAQIRGEVKVDFHQHVELEGNGVADEALTARIREVASTFHRNFSAGNFQANGPLVDENIRINSNGTHLKGREAFVSRIRRYEMPFPGMRIVDEHVLVDGRRACVSYHMEGTHKGDLTLPSGGVLTATGKAFRFRGIEFMHFNENAQMDELITISNMQDLMGQLSA